MTELIQATTEKMENSSEKILPDIEKIATATEKKGSQTEKIAEIIPEKIRYRGQRGADKTRRSFSPNSLRNLRQYRNGIPQKTGSNNWIWIVIGIVIAIIIGIVVWRVYEWWKENREDKKTELSEQLQFEKLCQT